MAPAKKDNRTRILEVALQLFNQEGSASVSTNHICAAAGVSPGNLYYHFRSKEEIIIAIFKEMIARWDENPPPSEVSLAAIDTTYEAMFTFLWEYRFIHREMATLCKTAPEFRKIFNRIIKRRFQETRDFIRNYIDQKVFRPMNKLEVERLVRTIWFFSLQWLSFLELEGRQVTPQNVRESIEILKGVLAPYLREKS